MKFKRFTALLSAAAMAVGSFSLTAFASNENIKDVADTYKITLSQSVDGDKVLKNDGAASLTTLQDTIGVPPYQAEPKITIVNNLTGSLLRDIVLNGSIKVSQTVKAMNAASVEDTVNFSGSVDLKDFSVPGNFPDGKNTDKLIIGGGSKLLDQSAIISEDTTPKAEANITLTLRATGFKDLLGTANYDNLYDLDGLPKSDTKESIAGGLVKTLDGMIIIKPFALTNFNSADTVTFTNEWTVKEVEITTKKSGGDSDVNNDNNSNFVADTYKIALSQMVDGDIIMEDGNATIMNTIGVADQLEPKVTIVNAVTGSPLKDIVLNGNVKVSQIVRAKSTMGAGNIEDTVKFSGSVYLNNFSVPGDTAEGKETDKLTIGGGSKLLDQAAIISEDTTPKAEANITLTLSAADFKALLGTTHYDMLYDANGLPKRDTKESIAVGLVKTLNDKIAIKPFALTNFNSADTVTFTNEWTVKDVEITTKKSDGDSNVNDNDNNNDDNNNNNGYTVITPDDTTAAADTSAPAEVVTGANGESVEAPKDVISEGAVIEANEQSKEEADKTLDDIPTTDDNKETVETVKDAVENNKAAIIDINLVLDGNNVQPNGNIKVTINIPTNLKGFLMLFVYRVESDGRFTDVRASITNGMLAFSTSHFSTYIVTSEALSGEAVVTEAAAAEATTSTEAAVTEPAATETTEAAGENSTEKNKGDNPSTGIAIAAIPVILTAGFITAAKRKK